MIFVTVGAQMPFDRLIKTVDLWARDNDRDDVFAQIGLTDYRPSNIQWTTFLKSNEFSHQYETASAIVAHAGTGSIITALQLGKPILIMPRQASLYETRNDHQLATSRQFARFDSVTVALDEVDLISKLNDIDKLRGLQRIETSASLQLVETIRGFIDSVK